MKIKTLYIILILLLISCENHNKQNKKQKEVIQESIEVVDEKTDTQTQNKTEYSNQNPNLKFEQIERSKIGKINDPDGYSNLRKEQNSKSEIITKISENEYFFYHSKTNSNWYNIKDLKGNIGFIHKSRVSEITNKKLYKFSFTDYNSKTKNEYRKDTIIEFKHLEKVFEKYWEGELVYQSIPSSKKTYNSISFKGNNLQVKFEKEKFNFEKNKISRKENYINKINNKEFWGTDGNIPKFQLKNIHIIENGINYTIPKNLIDDLFEPTLDKDYIRIIENINNGIIIEMANGDGAGAYVVIFFIENMNIKKRIIYRPF